MEGSHQMNWCSRLKLRRRDEKTWNQAIGSFETTGSCSLENVFLSRVQVFFMVDLERAEGCWRVYQEFINFSICRLKIWGQIGLIWLASLGYLPECRHTSGNPELKSETHRQNRVARTIPTKSAVANEARNQQRNTNDDYDNDYSW